MAQKRKNPDSSTTINANQSAMPWKSLNLSKLHASEHQNTKDKFVLNVNGAVPVQQKQTLAM